MLFLVTGSWLKIFDRPSNIYTTLSYFIVLNSITSQTSLARTGPDGPVLANFLQKFPKDLYHIVGYYLT